jgi:hypothetical protein
MLSPSVILMHIIRINTGFHRRKTRHQVLDHVFLCASSVAVHHCAASATPKGIPRVLRFATATAVPARDAGVHARGNTGYRRGLSLIKRQLRILTASTTPSAAPTSAALCSLLGGLLRGALRGKLLALGLVAPIPVSALAHGATVAHAQAPGAYLLRALLTPWTRALHEGDGVGAPFSALCFSPFSPSLRENGLFFFFFSSQRAIHLGPQIPQRRDARVDMRLAGGPGGEPTIVYIVGVVLFPFISTEDAARGLRLTCRELKQAVADFPWEDMKTVIRGSISLWRACFPRARGANMGQRYGYEPWQNPSGRRTPVVDADLVHFVGLRALNMRCCRQVTDAAFVHLRGIQKLNMSDCCQATITDAAFEHLKGIQVLDMSCCNQATITDAAFEHLKGIQKLNMNNCNQATITDAAFEHLKGIQRLSMSYCTQATITDAAFENLKGIQVLNMRFCNQNTITDAAFEHLKGIKELNMSGCNQATITDAAFEHLKGIQKLDMRACRQNTITDAAFAHLKGIEKLNMCYCNQATITDAAFVHLRGINVLYMYGCRAVCKMAAENAGLHVSEEDVYGFK